MTNSTLDLLFLFYHNEGITKLNSRRFQLSPFGQWTQSWQCPMKMSLHPYICKPVCPPPCQAKGAWSRPRGPDPGLEVPDQGPERPDPGPERPDCGLGKSYPGLGKTWGGRAMRSWAQLWPWEAKARPWEVQVSPWVAQARPWEVQTRPWEAQARPWEAQARMYLFLVNFCFIFD